MTAGANAVLREIRAPSPTNAYGDPSTQPGAVVWAGRVPCHLQVRTESDIDGGQSTIVELTELFARLADGAPARVEPGDRTAAATVLLDDLRDGAPAERTYRVRTAQLRGSLEAFETSSIHLTLADPAS